MTGVAGCGFKQDHLYPCVYGGFGLQVETASDSYARTRLHRGDLPTIRNPQPRGNDQ
jgi:hypothetical protein